MDYMAGQMDRQIEGAQVAYAAAMEDGRQPAFPVADYDYQTFNPATVDEAKRQLSGMSLRDYFAVNVAVDFDGYGVHYAESIVGRKMADFAVDPLTNQTFWADFRARMRYAEADAMLAARSA